MIEANLKTLNACSINDETLRLGYGIKPMNNHKLSDYISDYILVSNQSMWTE